MKKLQKHVLKLILEKQLPLVKFYEDKGVLYKIDANGSIDEVWERLLNIVNQ